MTKDTDKPSGTAKPKGRSKAPSRQAEVWGYAKVAEAAGVAVGTIRYYWSQKQHLLPKPDVMLGDKPGWYPGTIKEWVTNRPGQGFRSDLKDSDS
ncbi:hypothetical protein ACFC0S_16420 [Streptomyces sp. NPDC056084]|uniref:hypothetical protein n=1 Tax=unclassified Streptomyces TaxID=2593676 RepID=UPI0035DF4C5C